MENLSLLGSELNCVKKEEYLTEEEKGLMLEKMRTIYHEEYASMGALKNRRIVTDQDLPEVKKLRLHYSKGELLLLDIPLGIRSIYFVFKEDDIVVYSTDPSIIKMVHPDTQIIYIEDPKIGIDYYIPEFGDVDLSKIQVKEGIHDLYRMPWSTASYSEVKGSRIDVYLLRDGIIQFNLFNIEDVSNIIFRQSVLYDNALDLIIDHGQKSIPGDYRLHSLDDNLTICDPVLSAALRQQALIYMIGRPDEGKYVYKVTYIYVDEPQCSDTFFDVEKYNGESNIEYNNNLFKEC